MVSDIVKECIFNRPISLTILEFGSRNWHKNAPNVQTFDEIISEIGINLP
jgi:hypothetical protein